MAKIFKTLPAHKNPEQLGELFELFLTKEEIEMIRARYWIVSALLKGKLTQRQIAKKYKTSIAQITRGSNALKSTTSDLKNFLNKQFANNEEGQDHDILSVI